MEIHLVFMKILTSFHGNPSCCHGNPSHSYGNPSCFHRSPVDLQSIIKMHPWTCVKVSIIMSKFHGYLSMDPWITNVIFAILDPEASSIMKAF